MIDIQAILKQEVSSLGTTLTDQVTDPAEKLAIAQCLERLAAVPLMLARGEDPSIIVTNVKAELALRGVKHAFQAQAAVQQAWTNVIIKVVGAVIAAAV